MDSIDLDNAMNKFRLASRNLFNFFFRCEDPNADETGWVLVERFIEVQIVLFEKLVTEPASLSVVKYGQCQPEILVKIRDSESVPIMLNREKDSGYWDFPIGRVTQDAQLLFVGFFDWDQLGYRDNRYVRVQVRDWQGHSEVIGKHGLIESQYVKFAQG